jgi:hypothetical protein
MSSPWSNPSKCRGARHAHHSWCSQRAGRGMLPTAIGSNHPVARETAPVQRMSSLIQGHRQAWARAGEGLSHSSGHLARRCNVGRRLGLGHGDQGLQSSACRAASQLQEPTSIGSRQVQAFGSHHHLMVQAWHLLSLVSRQRKKGRREEKETSPQKSSRFTRRKFNTSPHPFTRSGRVQAPGSLRQRLVSHLTGLAARACGPGLQHPSCSPPARR